jgi:peptide-methionine (S)-S-oxide reductase
MKHAMLLAFLLLSAAPAAAEETSRPLPAPVLDLPASGARQSVVLAGGCFWGMQGAFQHVKGVKRVLAGYSGGSAATAHYEMVGTGTSGHAEAVEIVFDPHEISYGRILQVFFSLMDPTSLNYQGPDYGPQYRSEVFAADAPQQRIAETYIKQLGRVFSAPIVTRVSQLHGFYPAEAHHQDYLIRHPDQSYIAINDLPKIETLHRFYPDLWRAQPVTLARR